MTSAGTTPPSSHTSNPPPLTDADIIHLAQEQPQTVKAPPPDFLCPDSHQTLISYLRSRSASPSASSAVAEYTIALLSIISLSPHFPSRSSLVSSLLLAYIDLFNAHKIPHDSNSLKTIQLFTLHITNIPVKELASAAELIVDNFGEITDPDDAQFLDLLPTCLVLILRSNEIAKGQEFVELTLQRIVTSSWSNALLVKMVSVTRDFLFTDKNWRREFVDKVFHGMNGVDLQDVPSLIYQLLVAASKGFCKRKVIEGIVMFFGSRMDLKVTSAMRQVEGTILLHVNFAVKQDPSLGQEVVGLLKSDPRALNHFTLAILLSIARVRRFSESCMRVLKTTVLSAYQDYKVARNCKWMPNNVKKEYLQYVKIVEKEILRSANDTSYGREYVVPSIIQFGFLLLELVDEGNSMLSDKSDDVLGFEKLGIEILKMLFEAHDMSRTEIIDQCKFRILSLRPEQGQSIIRLLSFVVSSYPYTMLEHVSRLKDLLDYFTFMNNNIATYLITALLPLTKFSRDLQDYIILVVRKAMFSREYTVQVSAINAVVDLILADKRPRKGAPICLHESSSQASCSQQGEIACGKNAGLFTELSGLLQRSLYQQAKVKEIMYHGLVKLVSVDPLTAGPIFDFLLPHFLRFFREDGDVGLNISSCVKLDSGKLCIDEPLDCLLSCISWILLLQPHGKNGNSSEPWPCFDFSLSQDNEAGRIISGDLFSRSLQKIRKLLRNGQMEVLLGEVQDLGSASLGEEQKQCYASIISGIFEVFLNDIAAELEKSDDAQKVGLEKEIIDFVNLLESLREDARQSRPGHGVRRGNSKPTAGDIKFAHPSLSFWGTSSIYQLLLSAIKSFEVNCSGNDTVSQKHSQSCLGKFPAGLTKLIPFVLDASVRQIKGSHLMGENDPTRSLFYGEIVMLGPPLLKLLWLLVYGPKGEADERKEVASRKRDLEDRKDSINLALICLKELVLINLQTRNESHLIDELLSISASEHGPSSVEFGDYERLPKFHIDNQHTKSKLLFVVKVVKPFFIELLSVSFFREVEVLCQMVLVVGDKLPDDYKDYLGDWVISICKDAEIKDAKVVKYLVTLALHLKLPQEDLFVAEAMVVKMLNLTISDQTSVLDSCEVSEGYSILRQSTIAMAASCILQYTESVISDMQWATAKLKTCCIIARSRFSLNHDDNKASVSQLEETIYLRAEAVVKVLSAFMGMNLKDPQAEQLLKLSARFFKQLALMTKLWIAPKSCKQLLPTLTFQKLVDITCKQLTVPLYNFVSQMQQNQLENDRKKGIINKIKRENRCIPDLIFHIEDYEKYLIQLTKVTKVNLLRHAKRSTCRDFRILDPEKISGEDPATHEADDKRANACHNESDGNGVNLCHKECEDDQGIDSARDPSAESDGPFAADEVVSDCEDENMAPKAKRARRNVVVEDSDGE